MSTAPGSAKPYRLRPAAPGDSEELFRIHCEGMVPHLVEAFGEWSETADREHHETWIRSGRAEAILVDERIAGSLEVVTQGDLLWIRRIELDPRLHGRGVGTAILRDLQQRATENGLRVILDVFPQNPARRLYQRLGFRDARDAGPGPSVKMEWDPPGRPNGLPVDPR